MPDIPPSINLHLKGQKMKRLVIGLVSTAVLALGAITPVSHAAGNEQDKIKATVDRAIQPLMANDNIPGIAVGIIADGKTYVFNYGVASTKTGQPVTRNTLFEVGSVSKTFTATLASYAQVSGKQIGRAHV